MAETPKSTNSNPSPQDIPLDRLDFLTNLEKTRLDVWSLLHYAVSDANKDVTATRPDLIEKVLPGLKKKPEELTDIEISNLISAYNNLSQLVYPASVESLWLKQRIETDEREYVKGNIEEPSWWQSLFPWFRREQVRETAGVQAYNNTRNLKRWLYFIGVVVILLQAYNLFLSHQLETVDNQKTDLKEIQKLMDTVTNSVSPGLPNGAKSNPVFINYDSTKQEILWGLNNNYCVLRKVSFMWGWIYSNQGIDCATGRFIVATEQLANATDHQAQATGQQAEATQKLAQATDEAAKRIGEANQQAEAAKQQNETAKQQVEAAKQGGCDFKCQANAKRESFFAGATAVQRILNYLLLPTLLGSLGAFAFVIRELLKNYAEASYVIGNRRNRSMRIVLGPLLGLISGVLAYPNRDAFTAAAISPLVFGFLVGYSVEFAFSLFDALIAKLMSTLPAIIIPPKQAAAGATVSAPVPQVFKLDPGQGPSTGGGPITITGSGFSKDAKVSFGPNAANIDKVEETQITATVPPGQGTVNVTVQTGGGSSLSRPESQYTYLEESPSEPEDEGETHACDAGVQAEADTPDEELPAAHSGSETQRSA